MQLGNIITSPCIVRFHSRLPGGKGGFGSMLRAIGARIEKTTNHEACRDLSGRRMRDVNHEKQYVLYCIFYIFISVHTHA